LCNSWLFVGIGFQLLLFAVHSFLTRNTGSRQWERLHVTSDGRACARSGGEGDEIQALTQGGREPQRSNSRTLILQGDSRGFQPAHTNTQPQYTQLAASINHHYAQRHGYDFRYVLEL
jgi:hypothetical protein